jgi:NitT/TauT family transport system permease protein
VVSIVYFIMLVGTRAGMQTIDPDVRMMAVTLGLNKWHLLYQVNLPSAIPSMLAAFKLSSTYALLGAVTGELISAKAGLGQQLSHFAATFRVDGVMGTLLFLALFATVLNALANRFEAWLLRWQVDGTS